MKLLSDSSEDSQVQALMLFSSVERQTQHITTQDFYSDSPNPYTVGHSPYYTWNATYQKYRYGHRYR